MIWSFSEHERARQGAEGGTVNQWVERAEELFAASSTLRDDIACAFQLVREMNAARADLERRTIELLELIQGFDHTVARPPACACMSCKASVLLAEWKAKC